ncbi:unnamed protein product [Gemmata massiliana]|uniref:Uncharacterized protein n=1 Tax=Gemmata massiliana TaxID=1210884 RepID=A0A6P2DGL3_9BACT|nr:hypothetical protein [Gemmata massiliana]VTR98840.1 unnamed protein product [Gemmata massiliana]
MTTVIDGIEFDLSLDVAAAVGERQVDVELAIKAMVEALWRPDGTSDERAMLLALRTLQGFVETTKAVTDAVLAIKGASEN